MELTPQQKHVLYQIVQAIRSGTQQITMGGFAGTGKSVLVNYLRQFFTDFAVAAYTGKAANVLRKKGVHGATTIHSRIYTPVFENGAVFFDLNLNPGCSGFVIDEASMVSKDIYEDLSSYRFPMIFVGDHGQLEPIGADFNLMRNPDYRLEAIHRNAGDIARFAEHLRKGYAARGFKPEDGSVEFVSKLSVEDYLSVDQVICAYNATRVQINNEVRDALGHSGLLNVGERVMCLRNNRMQGLFNGMQGTVLNLSIGRRGRKYMDFESDGFVYSGIWYDAKQFGRETYDFQWGKDSANPFDYAYCATAHKCVHPDTLVETDDGLLPIKNIKADGKISTPYGVQEYRNFIHNPPSPALAIQTRNGQEITITEEHKVEICNEASFQTVLAKDLKVGDLVRVFIGSQMSGNSASLPMADPVKKATTWDIPTELSPELAEFLGLMVADGTIWDRGFRLAKRHPEVVERFITLCNCLFGVQAKRIEIYGTPAAEVDSVFLSRWLLSFGGLSPNAKDIPIAILKSDVSMQCHFLRGLFEDGWVHLCNQKFDHIGWHTAFPLLCQKTRVMLLRAGIVSTSLSTQPNSRLYIYGRYANNFARKVGFISRFKTQRLPTENLNSRHDQIPMSKDEFSGLRKIFTSDLVLTLYDYQNSRLRHQIARHKAQRLVAILKDREIQDLLLDRLRYFYSEVASIDHVESESMCVEVPNGHRFLQNGFPFFNSQGSEWDNVLGIEQKCRKWDHRRWSYTVASRPRIKLKWKLAF